ncbi:hypothetical protein GCM10023166_20010 [Paeniglutamicibacter cryotolerans]|uniref:Non-ribosomal peptide synthetase component E (Peptide arylation enzyme) n=1 Tax=Paeniglutamicibacter cryotolerans TaxID=670079 RepID=A0A839QGI2_9MICC|nr:non-ribosomal peptide synthetase component E (peptide arylation enzyme) [Paeniglutamicibacter cryotolerans]
MNGSAVPVWKQVFPVRNYKLASLAITSASAVRPSAEGAGLLLLEQEVQMSQIFPMADEVLVVLL